MITVRHLGFYSGEVVFVLLGCGAAPRHCLETSGTNYPVTRRHILKCGKCPLNSSLGFPTLWRWDHQAVSKQRAPITQCFVLVFVTGASVNFRLNYDTSFSFCIWYTYHTEEEALDRTQWRTRFGRGYGPVVRQTTEWNEIIQKHAMLQWDPNCDWWLTLTSGNQTSCLR
jgi:hypothetical protein